MKFFQNKKTIIATLAGFYILGIVLIICFLTQELVHKNIGASILIKYGVVIACLLFSALSSLFIKNKEELLFVPLTTLALAFTLVSDYFLLVEDDNYEIGVGVFILVQLAYFTRSIFINKYSIKELIIYSSIRILVPVIGIIIFRDNLLYCLTAIYFTQLVMNFVEALVQYIKNKKMGDLFLAIAFLLFIGCDVFVGLSNIGNTPMFISWIFYAPSQLLLASNFLLRKYYEKEE